jgi:hypothetical protein
MGEFMSILWLDDYVVRRPVNKINPFRLINWTAPYYWLKTASAWAWKKSEPIRKWLGDLVCAVAIPAMLIIGAWFWVSIVALVRGL